MSQAPETRTGRMSAAGEQDAVDGMAPRRIVHPGSAQDVRLEIAEARAKREALLARGGGTLLELGNRPTSLSTILSMDGMNRIVERCPDDMIVTVEAGVTLGELDEALQDVGQRVGLSAWAPGKATVGGVVATNTSASLSYGFGFPRDQILGLEVVDGTGRFLRCGGRVVKNVAGYDLPRLFLGSFGTLGIVTGLTLRTHPRPVATERLLFRFSDGTELDRARARVFRSSLPLSSFQAAVVTANGEARWYLRFEIEGTERQVDSMRSSLYAFCGSDPVCFDERDDVAAPDARAVIRLRIGTNPDDAIPLAATWIRRAAEDSLERKVVIDCHLASLSLSAVTENLDTSTSLVTSSRALARNAGAALICERLPGQMKEGIDVWGGEPEGMEIMRRIKRRFDPDGILAPGRFVGGM
jgi:glycolate oxidase FAD binding subunit